jgi:hypothetical protein
MDLIERYLAVAERCPGARRPGDLGGELRRLLLARVERRETALGRPLRAPEAAVELAAFARRLLAEARAVMRHFEDACLSLPETLSLDSPEGES